MNPNQRLVRRCSAAQVEEDGLQQDRIPTPREAMRQSNCQDYRFHRTETYPSIRPQVSPCDPSKEQAIAWLTNSLEADGCGRPFDEKQDDVLLQWQHCPDKDTLGFYGVGSPTLQPESVMFNQALMASLSKANVDGTRRRSKRTTPPTQPKKTPILGNSVHNQMCQPLILNRQALQAELHQMPVVQQRLHPRTAFETVFCTDPVDPYDPLGVARHQEMMVSRDQALDMERPPKETPHGLRRRHWYCPSDCGGEQNPCTQYEWAKYKLDPRPYNKEFRQWMSEQKTITNPEPKDYDQLYERFLTCFEQEPSPDPLCKIYEICCRTKDSRDDDGRGGGDGGHGGGRGKTGGEGDDDGTGGKDKAKDGSKNKNKEMDNDKDKDKNKEKNKDKNKDTNKDTNKDKNKDKDMDKDIFNDKDRDYDKDKNKNKDKIKDDGTDKNKNKDKDTGKEIGDGKYKGKGDGDKDKDNARGDGRRLSGDSLKGKKKKKTSFADSERPTKISEWTSDDAMKIPSWAEDGDQDPGRGPMNNRDNQLVPGEGGTGTGYDYQFNPTDPGKSTKRKSGNGKKKNTKKDKGKGKGNAKDNGKGKVGKTCPVCPPVGCPCEICCFMNRFRGEDAPFIREMQRAEKKRQLRDYTRQMCHREYIRNRCQQDLQRPPFEKHRDCLGAVQDLEKLLAGCHDKGLCQKLLSLVENLRRRIYQRMSDCIHPHLNCSGAQFGFN